MSFVVALTFCPALWILSNKSNNWSLVALALIVAVVYFMIRLYFIPHAISIERIDCFKAFSVEYDKGKGKESFGPYALVSFSALPCLLSYVH